MRRPPLTLTAIITFAAAASLPAQAAVARQVLAMGTALTVSVCAPSRDTALAASEQAIRAVAAIELRLSVWRTDSDVSRVNAARPGIPVRVEPETVEELRWAFAIASCTGFAFDPTVGPLVQAYGLREGGRWPDVHTLHAARDAVGIGGFRFGDSTIARCRPAAALDCDAFAKGLALDRALAAARAAGAVGTLLDFGGQVACDGDIGREVWLPIAHPGDRQRLVAEVLLAPGWSAATSGNGEREAGPEGHRVPHLLDPRTGRPAADFGSATALARRAALADAASTALFVLGPHDVALPQACARLGTEAVMIELRDDGADARTPVRVRATPGLAGRVRAVSGAVEFFPSPSCPSRQ